MQLKYTFLVFLLIGFFLPHFSFASVSWQTSQPVLETFSDFPVVGSGATSTPLYSFIYEIPVGIEFDRVVISVPSTQATTSILGSTYLGTITAGNEPWNCLNSNCVNGQFSVTNSLTESLSSKPTDTTIQQTFSTTTLVTTGTYLWLVYDSGVGDIGYNATPNQDNAAALNGSNYANSLTVPAIKLCNGSCVDYDFSPVAMASESPWVRLLSPSPNYSTILDESGNAVNLQFQVNTGTTTADSVVVRFNSSIQSLTPYEYTIVTTGISDFSYLLNLPYFGDYITYNATVYSSTTALYVSPTYSLNISQSGVISDLLSKENCEFSFTDLTTWWDCTASFFGYMFIPPESASLTALAWYTVGTESTQAQGSSAWYEYYTDALTLASASSSASSLDMSIPINVGSATITIPVLSISQADEKMGSANELFRLVCLGALVLFAINQFWRQIESAWLFVMFNRNRLS